MSARCPFMCCFPLWKRQPCQREQRAWLEYGQSKRFERMFSGTSISIPPTSSMSCLKLPKSTVTTWLTGRPVKWRTVLIASAGPPIWNAALILLSPWRWLGSVRTSMIESEWRSDARELELEWSVPRRRMSVAWESSSPSCGVRAAFVRALTRWFALATPPRKER